MREIGVIFRREMGAYFNSTIAYVFIVVFLLLTAGIFLNSFFLAGVADMRGYFGLLQWFLPLFMPALSMRLWAEDQRLHTFELLMTLPMKPWQIVLGKYLAGLAFYGITLACTITLPLSVAWIGSPDLGAIVAGYVGALLLGAMYLAVGIFVSGFFRDQITAFVLALLACGSFLLLGDGLVMAKLDSWVNGLGTFLADAFGVAPRFSGIERGVIGLADVGFFLSFSVVFLVLNTLSLQGRKY